MQPVQQTESANDYGAFVPGHACRRAATGRGELDGLHFAVKDLIDVTGYCTGGGNPDWLRDQTPALDSAAAVKLLLAAGASLAGKTMTDELGFSLEGCNAHYGTPTNPACPDRVPGGSSSGSAVAVASGLVDFALGTDTGGSVRVPASFVGIYGFRPTHGAISLRGVVPFAPSYDTVGWFARETDLLSLIGSVLISPSRTPPIDRVFIVGDAFALADPLVARLLRERAARWPIAGEVSLFDGDEQTWYECYRVLQGAEIWQSLGPWIIRTMPHFGASIVPRFKDAAAVTVEQVEQYRPLRAKFAARLKAIVSPNTALAIPTAPCAALRRDADSAAIAEFYRRALTLTSVAGHTGAPQISVPVAREWDCPIGLSLIGAPGCDLALLDLAVRLQRRQAETRPT